MTKGLRVGLPLRKQPNAIKLRNIYWSPNRKTLDYFAQISNTSKSKGLDSKA